MTGRERIAFHIVTGFLGAGKTTLINRLLRAPELADALVIVNEWGEIGLDHLLYEQFTGDAILINSGCVCCALRGDLVDAGRGKPLGGLTRSPRFDAPDLAALTENPVAPRAGGLLG